jgi:hypothetical protein
MYFRKARLDQRPISMIEKIGTPAMYMAIAAPERIKCIPILEWRMPSFVLPMATTPSLIRLDIISDVMLMIFFLCWAKETSESLLVPLYERIHVIMDAHSLIGHIIGSAVLLFCCSKVMETQSAKFSSADEWSRMMSSLMKAIVQRQSCFICCCSAFVTLQYLHHHMAQKWAAATSSPIACCNSVDLEERMRWRTQMGKAFCCFSLALWGRPFCTISVAIVEVG